jgi:hypothetical protein
MKSSVSSCPVPFEQQPLNEYQELKESWFFRWGMLDLPQYIRKLLWIWGWSWLIAGPIAAASFPPAKYPAQFALTGMAGAALFLLLVLIRLYLGWTYIRSRLSNATIFYEESGWYDGQLWEKPPEMLAQDRLVVTYQIQPILKRLTQTFGVLAIGLVAGVLAWQFL